MRFILDSERQRRIHELVRRVITDFIEDAIAESAARLKASRVASADDVRALDHAIAGFSPAMAAHQQAIKSFLFQNMYRHPDIKRIRVEAAGVARDLFDIFFKDPELMPPEWASLAITRGAEDEAKMARVVCDYIAGMTDRYALAEHQRLFDETPELR